MIQKGLALGVNLFCAHKGVPLPGFDTVHGTGPGQNVYAELGTTWYTIMNDTTQSAHVLGKLLMRVAPEVYTIELVPELAAEARALLRRLGYARIHVRTGDGYEGWPEEAPFDRVLVTAAPDEVPGC
jgi:hypothetical protein